ncbi:MAG TPA: DUF2157 domain-containing protein, partial [Nitrospirota bacterium]
SEQSGSWGRIAFAVAGAVLIGLGVILLFAYNWEKMHKFAKLGVIFLALISAHSAALIVNRPAARETLHALGTMLFGAGIWLVAQVYHINEHYPNAFLVWGIGALSLAWFLPSLPQALMAAFLFVLWNGFEVFDFHNRNYPAAIIILFGVLPLAGILRSRVLASAGLAAFLFTLFNLIENLGWILVMPVFFSVAAALIAVGLILKRAERFTELAPPCFFYGNVLYFLILYILSFRGTREALIYLTREHGAGHWFTASLVIALGLWVYALWPFHTIRERIDEGLRVDYLAVPVALILYSLQFFGVIKLEGALATMPYNLLVLFSAVMLMQHGFRTLHLRSAVMGSLLLTALAIARYTDLFQSLLARAAVFLLVGGMMVGIGIFFARARKAKQEAAR